MIWNTNINHPARKKLGITCNEYCIVDLVYHLSNNPKARVKGWCNASRSQIADTFDLSKRSAINLIQKMIDKKLVKKHTNGWYLKTTNVWYDAVILYEKVIEEKLILGGEESSPLDQEVKKVHPPKGEESSPQEVKKVHRRGEESSPYINNSNSNKKKESERAHTHTRGFEKFSTPLQDNYSEKEKLGGAVVDAPLLDPIESIKQVLRGATNDQMNKWKRLTGSDQKLQRAVQIFANQRVKGWGTDEHIKYEVLQLPKKTLKTRSDFENTIEHGGWILERLTKVSGAGKTTYSFNPKVHN